jgi:hypothetical protein
MRQQTRDGHRASFPDARLPNAMQISCGGLRRPPPTSPNIPRRWAAAVDPGSSKRWLGGAPKLVASQVTPRIELPIQKRAADACPSQAKCSRESSASFV